jgi:hypothetical protein
VVKLGGRGPQTRTQAELRAAPAQRRRSHERTISVDPPKVKRVNPRTFSSVLFEPKRQWPIVVRDVT